MGSDFRQHPPAKTWTIRFDEHGREAELDPMTEAEAKQLADELRRHFDPNATLVDLLEELRDRLPEGSRVRNINGQLGTVTAGLTVDGAETAHVIDGFNGQRRISIRLDGQPHPGWFVADYFGPANETDI